MSLFSSIGNIIGGTAKAVVNTAARAVTVAPLIAANIVAPKSQLVQKATNLYNPTQAIKQAGTTLSVASLAAGGIAATSAIKAGTSLLAPKIVGAAVSGAAGSTLTAAPNKSSEALEKAPSAIGKVIDLAGNNPVAAVAALSALPLVAYGAVKSVGAVSNIATNLIGGKSDLNNVTDKAQSNKKSIPEDDGGILGDEDIPPLAAAPLAAAPSSNFINSSPDIPSKEATSLTPKQSLTPILSKKPYKRRKPKEPIKVSQRVMIGIKNSNVQKIYKHNSH